MEQKYPLGLSRTGATMCAAVGGLFVVLLGLGELAIGLVHPFERPLPFAVGLLLGCLLSVAKIVLLEKSLSHSVELEEKNAKNYSSLQSILRFFLTIAVLLSVVLFPKVVGLFGTVLGILSLQLSAYVAGFVMRKRTSV